MHAVEAGRAVDEAKAGGGGDGGGGGAGQKQGAAAARLRSALEDRVIKLEAARYEERAAVDFFNTAMRVDKCYHLLHDEGMYPCGSGKDDPLWRPLQQLHSGPPRGRHYGLGLRRPRDCASV